jgi:hypothetical protein
VLPLFGLVVLALLLTLASGSAAMADNGPNRAALVIHIGDGQVRYALVEFDEPEITGMELLTRSGLDVVVSPFGGLGGGVCAIESRGCPATNCFCESYRRPAFFWHYYRLTDEGWQTMLAGAASRTIRDGDVDGWSWTDGEPHLPLVTIAEIEDRIAGEQERSADRHELAIEEDTYDGAGAGSATDTSENPATSETESSPRDLPNAESEERSSVPVSYAGFAALLAAASGVAAWRLACRARRSHP